MAIDNAICWIFTPDLEESNEMADYGHTFWDNNILWPSDKRFDPADASAGELKRAARQYFGLSAAQVNALNIDAGDIAIPIAPEWAHTCDEIYIFIHRDFDQADENLLPALAQARLALLRAGDPTYGLPL